MGLKKGPWTSEEDQKLLAFIQEHGHGSWRALPEKAGNIHERSHLIKHTQSLSQHEYLLKRVKLLTIVVSLTTIVVVEHI